MKTLIEERQAAPARTAPAMAPRSGSCCGRWVVVLAPAKAGSQEEVLQVGTVVDFMAGEVDKPKRIRIQRGARQGEVVGIGEYVFKGWLEETEVDP